MKYSAMVFFTLTTDMGLEETSGAIEQALKNLPIERLLVQLSHTRRTNEAVPAPSDA